MFDDAPDFQEFTEPAKQRPYEVAYEKTLKDLRELRDSIARLRDQIKPALQAETAEKLATSEGSVPQPPLSPVVRDLDNIRYEVGSLTSLVRSISNRVYL